MTNSSNIVKENASDIVINYDRSEYAYLKNYINYWYNNVGKQTFYHFEFGANFSNLILNTMFMPGATYNYDHGMSCLLFKILRGQTSYLSIA